MSFKGEERKIKEKQDFTGIGEVYVVAVNPTAKEISELIGAEVSDEPSYITERADGSKSTRIDFWVKPLGYETYKKLTFWLNHDITPSQSGNYEWINDNLKQTWAPSKEAVLEKLEGDMGKWFKSKGLRKAYRGELDLYNFLSTLFNLDTESENGIEQFENIEAIVKGDVSELKQIINNAKENTIKLLFGINDNGYQEIYNRYFLNSRSNRYTTLLKYANEEYTKFKGNYFADTEFKVYDGNNVPQEKETKVSASNLF